MPNFFSSIFSILLAADQRVLAWSNRPQQPHRASPEPQDKIRTLCREPIHPVVQELRRIIEKDADLYTGFHQMFEQIPDKPKYQVDPTGNPHVFNYKQMLGMLDTLLTRSPEFGDGEKGELVPPPFNAMLNSPMCTAAGFRVFPYDKVNAQIKKILDVWSQFLSSPDSRYVLTEDAKGWFGPFAIRSMPNFADTFECDPSLDYYGFASWDDFFTRRFRPGFGPSVTPRTIPSSSTPASQSRTKSVPMSKDIVHSGSKAKRTPYTTCSTTTP